MKGIDRYYVALAYVALTACQPRQQTDTATATAGDEAAIAQVLQRERAAAGANNADSMAAVFSVDATVKSPNEPPVTGAALQSWFQNMFTNATIDEITYTDEHTSVSGDMAQHTFGYDWTVTPKGGQAVREKGHGIHLLQRQADGTWRIKYDIWSADAPPPTARGGD